jgi:DNA-binding MarR family transcriptional regulator
MTDSPNGVRDGRNRRVLLPIVLSGVFLFSVLLSIPVAATAVPESGGQQVLAADTTSEQGQFEIEATDYHIPRSSSYGHLLPAEAIETDNSSWFGEVFLTVTSDVRQSEWLHAQAGRQQYSTSPDGETRAHIFETIQESPGAHISSVTEQTDVHRSTVRHHVHELEKDGWITSSKVQGKRRLFPRGHDEDNAQAVLADDAAADVLLTIYRNEPATVSEVAAELGRSPSTVSYHLERLESLSLLTRDQEGNEVYAKLTPGTASTVREWSERPRSAANTTPTESD